VIHRAWDDLSKGEKTAVIGGSILGGLGLIALVAWLASRKGPEDIDNEPECGPRQDKVILPVLSRAKQWLLRATGRVRAYRARPRDPANQAVDRALNRRFNSADPAVVEKVERVLVHTYGALWHITSDAANRRCHTTKHAQCSNNGKVRAFASRGIGRINFCQSFFGLNESEAAEIVIHEVTHSLVGGAAIHDRAYQGERRFGGGPEPNRLNTDENLTNAESYASFVVDLATGEVFGQAPPADVLECPPNWRGPVKDVLSLVQRADIRFLLSLSQTNPSAKETLDQKWGERGQPGPPPPVEAVKRAILAVVDALSHPIHIVCNADAAVHCRDGDVEWVDQAQERTINLCAGWLARDQRTRTASILAGLYGWVGGIDNRVWRTALAEIAIDTARDPQFAPAAHDDVFGRAGWTPDLLRVEYIPYYPLTKLPFYFATGRVQVGMSKDLPVYAQTDCHDPTLTLSFEPRFLIDVPPVPRPGPYTRPRLWVKYTHPSRNWEAVDTNAIPSEEAGAPVDTFLSRQAHRVTFDTNGTFAVEIGLHDPDSGVTRKYHDQITVEPVLACPDAVTSADPRAVQATPAAAPGAPAPNPTPAPAPVKVQRAADTGRDVGIGLAIGGGVAAGGLVAAWAAGAFDSKKKKPEDKSKGGKAQTTPTPQTAGPPLPKISFDEAMEEGANRLKPAFGTACGLRKGQDPSDGYDARDWREDPSRSARGLIIVATTPSSWVAVDHLIKNIGTAVPKAGGGETRWHFDCFEGVHVLRLYAYWRTLSQAEFDKRFPTLEIGFDSTFNLEWEKPIQSKNPKNAPYVEGPPKAIPGQMNFMPSENPVGKSWATLLAEAPKGSQVIWSNVDAAAQCGRDPNLSFCAFQNENATKLGPDRYWAHPFGIVNEQTVKNKMSEAVLGHVDQAYIKKNVYVSALRHPKERFEA